MKKLKQTTIDRYSARQLAKHINRLDQEKYLIDLSYGQVLVAGDNCWRFHCSIIDQNKYELIEVLNDIHFEAKHKKKEVI